MVSDATFAVLGPLEVVRDGELVAVPAGKQRTILAALLLRCNRTVPLDELIDKLWGRHPPLDARGAVQKYVMRLRHVLGGDLIHTEPDGYRIEVLPHQLDLNRFTDLVRDGILAGEAGDLDSESWALREALALWRGRPPLSNVPSESMHQHEVPQLVERYLQVTERHIEVDLALGQHNEAISELMSLVQEEPLRERLWVLRMRALVNAGRQGEALDAYRTVVQLLAEELGVAPGPELRSTHREILHGTIAESSSTTASVVARPTVHQLPATIAGFVGREHEVDEITAVLDSAARGGPPRLVAVTGPAGAGKTTLVVRAAHGVGEHFPDGQLFADFRAYAHAAPAQITDVLGQFLRTLGVAEGSVPLQLDDQVLVYRSLLAGRRMMVVLDNVQDEDQVRALLPGSSGCAVVVTSRNELAGLAVSPGASRFVLGMLTGREARELLRESIGAQRVAADEQACEELVRLCGGLALALRVAAAHLLLQPDLQLAEYVQMLRSEGPIWMLRIEGDERANLAAAFDWSYRSLEPDRQHMLRLLSLAPGPDIGPHTAAALTGVADAEATFCLEALAAASLLERTPCRSRYQLHDLVREYARRRCLTEETRAERQAARRRLFDHYIAVSDAAVRQHIELSTLSRPAFDAGAVTFKPTLETLDQYRSAMVAAVRDAAEHGPYEAAYHLADVLRGYFTLRGHAVDWHAVVEAGLSAARKAGSDEAVAAMLNSRGALAYYTADSQVARKHFMTALEIYERLDLPAANAVRVNLGIVAELDSDLRSAVQHHEAARTGASDLGDVVIKQRAHENLILALLSFGDLERARSEGAALANESPSRAHYVIGIKAMITQRTGDLRLAAEQFDMAAALATAAGDHRTEVGIRALAAQCLLELGNDEEAERAALLALARAERDDPRNVPIAALTLGAALLRVGKVDLARTQLDQALTTARDAHDVDNECGALIGLADLELVALNVVAATSRASEAAAQAHSSMRRLRLAHALIVLATCQRHSGDLSSAMLTATHGRETARNCHYPLGQALALAELGEIQLSNGQPRAAHQSWQTAATIYQEIGSFRLFHVQTRLSALNPATDPDAD